MNILNSKGGKTRPSAEMKVTQRAGDRYKNTTHDLSGKELADLINSPVITLTQEEILLEEIKVKNKIEEARLDFETWKKVPHEEKYKNEIITNPNHVIIQVYYYNSAPKSSSIIIAEDAKESFIKILPIAKVLASNSENIFPGDIVRIPSIFGKTVQSKEYLEWQMAKREKPTIVLDWPEPPKYIGKLNDWSQYIVQIDPFVDSGLDDQYIFCVPDRYIQTKIKN